jgi:hypothetical protein
MIDALRNVALHRQTDRRRIPRPQGRQRLFMAVGQARRPGLRNHTKSTLSQKTRLGSAEITDNLYRILSARTFLN